MKEESNLSITSFSNNDKIFNVISTETLLNDEKDASSIQLREKIKIESSNNSKKQMKNISNPDLIVEDKTKNIEKMKDSTITILNILGKIKHILVKSINNPLIFLINKYDKELIKEQLNRLVNQDKIIWKNPPNLINDKLDIIEEKVNDDLNETLKLNLILFEMDDVASKVKDFNEYHKANKNKVDLAQDDKMNFSISAQNSNKRKDVYKRLFDICKDSMNEISSVIKKEFKKKKQRRKEKIAKLLKNSDKIIINSSETDTNLMCNSSKIDKIDLLLEKNPSLNHTKAQSNGRNTFETPENNFKYKNISDIMVTSKSTENSTIEKLTNENDNIKKIDKNNRKYINPDLSKNWISKNHFTLKTRNKKKSESLQSFSTSIMNFNIISNFEQKMKLLQNVNLNQFTIFESKSSNKDSNSQFNSSKNELKIVKSNKKIKDRKIKNRAVTTKNSNISFASDSSKSIICLRKTGSHFESKVKLKDYPLIKNIRKSDNNDSTYSLNFKVKTPNKQKYFVPNLKSKSKNKKFNSISDSSEQVIQSPCKTNKGTDVKNITFAELDFPLKDQTINNISTKGSEIIYKHALSYKNFPEKSNNNEIELKLLDEKLNKNTDRNGDNPFSDNSKLDRKSSNVKGNEVTSPSSRNHELSIKNNIAYLINSNPLFDDFSEDITDRSKNFINEINDIPTSKIINVNKSTDTNLKFKIEKYDFKYFSSNISLKNQYNELTVRSNYLGNMSFSKFSGRSKSNNFLNSSFNKLDSNENLKLSFLEAKEEINYNLRKNNHRNNSVFYDENIDLNMKSSGECGCKLF